MKYTATVGYSTPAQPNSTPPLNLRLYIPLVFGAFIAITLVGLVATVFCIVRFNRYPPVYCMCVLLIWLFRQWRIILFKLVDIRGPDSQLAETPRKNRKPSSPPIASKVVPIDLEQKSAINPDFG